MSEATGRQEMERRLIERSLEDDVFRKQLLADPRAIIEREVGTPLPEGVRVVAVEETTDTIYLVLPSAFADRRRRRALGAGARGGGRRGHRLWMSNLRSRMSKHRTSGLRRGLRRRLPCAAHSTAKIWPPGIC